MKVKQILHLCLFGTLLTKVHSHAVEIRECFTNNGTLRVFFEHTHGNLTNTTLFPTIPGSLEIEEDADGFISVETVYPSGLEDHPSDRDALPGCYGPSTLVNSCYNVTFNNWVSSSILVLKGCYLICFF